jgi:hypothetical protein
VRSDNLSIELLSLAVEARDASAADVTHKCIVDETD